MHINSMNNYIHLADQIIKGNNPQACESMAQYINDTNNLDTLLHSIEYSDNLHFIFTEMLAKSILNGQFCPINETKSDDNSLKQNQNQKIKVYSAIMSRIFNTILKKTDKNLQYIVRSGLNLISVCLKDLCQNNRNLNFVQDFMNIFFPQFKVNEDFTNNFQNELIFIQPRQNTYIPEHYGHNIKIFNSLLQYVTMLSYYKSYYEYRRNIYTFRNTYLSIFLNLVVQYFKAIYYQWNANQKNQQLIELMNQSVSLLQKVVNYPFTLSLHQFENDDEASDNISGISGQIYFPNYFRHVILDKRFIEMVFKYFVFLLNQLQNITPMRQTINCLTRIIGRFLSASSYCFNSDSQRRDFRNSAVDIAIHMAYNFKFYDAYYLHSLCDILCKVLTAYSQADFQGKKIQLIEAILAFSYNLVQKSQIKLQDGKRNPFNRAFELVVNCLDESREETYYQDTKNKAQVILEKGFIRLIDNKEANKIMEEYGKNIKGEIQCFQELYGSIYKIFILNFESNIANFNSIDLSQLNQNSQITWLHLCSLLLVSCMSQDQQTKAILKYFELAKNGQSLAALHYLKILVHQVMFQIQQGVATTKLWKNIQFQTNVSFSNFIMFVIKLCKKNFNQQNTDLIDYSLQVFKSIYLMLKKNDSPEFLSFYDEVKILISSINSTVFANVKFFKKRVSLFSVISIIWVNTNQFAYLYEIYNLVASSMRNQPTLLSLLKFIHDITGILQPIDNFQTFKVVGELALIDLRKYLPIILTGTNIDEAFSQQSFLKAFCKLALAFSNDSSRRLTYITHTDLPFQIQQLFKPYLIQCLKYDYPKCLVTVWLKFVPLNPLQNLFPLPESMKKKQSKDYQALIKEYFDNIHRIQNLQVLYPYIEDNTDYLVNWWEEVMNRNLKPTISLKVIVDSRIATTKRQKQNLAKLIYDVGKYDSAYWDVSGFSSQREFVSWFLSNYKDFKQI